MTGGTPGTYLEIGASHPVDINNTFLIEKNGWDGISIDIDNQCESIWKLKRTNKLIIADATTYPYPVGKYTTYLSLDCEPASTSYAALRRLIDRENRFGIITFEHEWYYDKTIREIQRELLKSHGYYLAVPDVKYIGQEYEDWWIDPKVIDIKLLNTWVQE